MTDQNDTELLQEYARTQSEAVFAILVERHINLVYSAALRFTKNPHHAEEITQAVFLILTRKAASLRRNTLLSGWLYQTARLTSANFVKSEIRRQRREQEAYMQSTLNTEESSIAWEQLAPFLDEAMGQLCEIDRNAIVLRYFENKTNQEVAEALNLKSAAIHMRVTRALEKLRKFLVKRNITLSASLIAGAMAANSVQAAPVGLAVTVTATAAKGAAVGSSTLTLIKGVLKVMAWTKAKMAIVVGASVLITGMTTVVVENAITHANSILKQTLSDGSLLIVNQASFGEKHEFIHGTNTNNWTSPGLIVEFSLVSEDPENHPFVKPIFFRQFRCVLRGTEGIEYVREFTIPDFKKISGGYYGYVRADSFPRDSRWLWLRIEKRDDPKRYDEWRTVAEFKFSNPTRPANRKWKAPSTPATNTVDGMDFVLNETTFKTMTSWTNDIWNHVITFPTEVWNQGVLLTNWSPTYVHAEDASGNSTYLRRNIGLDPRCVWKLDMDFEPTSNFSEESLATLYLPVAPEATLITNVMGMPVTFSWMPQYSTYPEQHYLEANMPTNHPNLALKFVSALDEGGTNIAGGNASWDKYFFRRQIKPTESKFVKVTFAVVPNVHTTFYTQPRLISNK